MTSLLTKYKLSLFAALAAFGLAAAPIADAHAVALPPTSCYVSFDDIPGQTDECVRMTLTGQKGKTVNWILIRDQALATCISYLERCGYVVKPKKGAVVPSGSEG